MNNQAPPKIKSKLVEDKDIYSQSKKDFYEETKNDYEERYLDPVPTEKSDIKIIPADLGENEVAVNLPDFNENFHNPDLSKLPKEIPIPGHENYIHESAEKIREIVAAQEIPVLEQQPTEETQHRRQLALRQSLKKSIFKIIRLPIQNTFEKIHV